MKRQHNSFLTPLIVEVMPSGKKFKLHYDFTYLWKRENTVIHIKAGFITDFASIPGFARIIIPKLGKYNKAAVVHDAIYQQEYGTSNTADSYDFTRKEADMVFRDAMIDLGVAKWKYTLMYYAVRLGGWASWRKR